MKTPVKCKRVGCSEPAAPGQIYCSREHAPLAMLYSDGREYNGGRTPAPDLPGRVRPNELARILEKPVETLYDWARKGRIPSETRGSYVYFDVQAVREAMEAPEFSQPGWNKAASLRPRGNVKEVCP